jgi:hypothetical protein
MSEGESLRGLAIDGFNRCWRRRVSHRYNAMALGRQEAMTSNYCNQLHERLWYGDHTPKIQEISICHTIVAIHIETVHFMRLGNPEPSPHVYGVPLSFPGTLGVMRLKTNSRNKLSAA